MLRKINVKRLFLIFALAGCGSSEQACEYKSQSWESFPVSVQTATEADYEVLNFYNEYFNTEIFTKFDSEQILFDRTNTADCTIELSDDLGENIRGHTWTHWNNEINNCEIRILKTLDEQTYRNVLAHELGHALGFNHCNNPDSLMNHSVDEDSSLEELFAGDFEEMIFEKYSDLIK